MPTLAELEAERARRSGGGGGRTLAELEAEKARRANPSIAGDMLQQVGAGLRSGGEMLLGMPGDVNAMTQSAAGRIARALFGEQTASSMKEYVPTGLRSEGVTTPQVREASTEMLGPNPEAKTTPGRYTRSVFEQVPTAVVGPGGRLAKIAAALFGGLGAEAGGEFAPEGYEDVGRVVGGMVGGGAGGSMRPGPTAREAAREANLATLQREGVPLSAAQQTGSTTGKFIESELGGGTYEALLDRQRTAFTDASMRRLGEAGGAALPEDLVRARGRIGGEFDRLTATTAVPFDQTLQNDLLGIATDYAEVAPQIVPAVENLMNRMGQMAARNGGTLNGENYKEMVTKLRELGDSADVPTGQAFSGFRDALDSAVERTLGGPELEAWQRARQQYANLMTVERAMTGGAQEAATGMIAPTRLRSAISGGGQGPVAIAEGRSNMTDLANAGVGVMKDLPQSGTAPRTAARAIPAAAAGIGAGWLTGDPFSAAGAATLGFAAPEIMGKAVMSPLGQSALLGPTEAQRLLLASFLAGRQGGMGGRQ